MAIKKEFIIPWEYGLHVRPVGLIYSYLQKMRLDYATGSYKDVTASLLSILSGVLLCVAHGEQIKIEVSGPDQEKAMSFLTDLFSIEDETYIYEKYGNGRFKF
jgi:phosphocarrier protein NPr